MEAEVSDAPPISAEHAAELKELGMPVEGMSVLMKTTFAKMMHENRIHALDENGNVDPVRCLSV